VEFGHNSIDLLQVRSLQFSPVQFNLCVVNPALGSRVMWLLFMVTAGVVMVIDFRIRVISLTCRLGFGVRFGLESSTLGADIRDGDFENSSSVNRPSFAACSQSGRDASCKCPNSGGGGKCLLYLRSATRRRWRTIGRKRINVSYTLRDVTAETASSAVHAVQSLHSSPPSVGRRPNLTAAMLTRPPRDTRPPPTATVQPKVSIKCNRTKTLQFSEFLLRLFTYSYESVMGRA